MKKLLITLLILAMLLALVPASTVSAAPGVSKTAYCAQQTEINKIPGEMWLTDNNTVLHVRGQTTYSEISPLTSRCSNQYSQGSLVMTVNFDVNVVTGEGVSWGTSTKSITGISGSFVGPFVGKIEGGMFQGESIAKGTGALKGLTDQAYISQIGMDETGMGTYEIHGYVYSLRR